jgi:hypothetical protein
MTIGNYGFSRLLLESRTADRAVEIAAVTLGR